MIVNYADHSSNERTFLAWVRTAIAIEGFGMAAARLGNDQPQVWTEVAMFAAGAVVVLLAFLRMRHIKARISASLIFDDDTLPTDTLLMLLVASLFALLATFALHVS
jgi:putative membrane protein